MKRRAVFVRHCGWGGWWRLWFWRNLRLVLCFRSTVPLSQAGLGPSPANIQLNRRHTALSLRVLTICACSTIRAMFLGPTQVRITVILASWPKLSNQCSRLSPHPCHMNAQMMRERNVPVSWSALGQKVAEVYMRIH